MHSARSGLRRAQFVSRTMSGIPVRATPPSIISWGGIRIRSRPIRLCHWMSQLVPKKHISDARRTTAPRPRRSIQRGRSDGVGIPMGRRLGAVAVGCHPTGEGFSGSL